MTRTTIAIKRTVKRVIEKSNHHPYSMHLLKTLCLMGGVVVSIDKCEGLFLLLCYRVVVVGRRHAPDEQ